MPNICMQLTDAPEVIGKSIKAVAMQDWLHCCGILNQKSQAGKSYFYGKHLIKTSPTLILIWQLIINYNGNFIYPIAEVHGISDKIPTASACYLF